MVSSIKEVAASQLKEAFNTFIPKQEDGEERMECTGVQLRTAVSRRICLLGSLKGLAAARQSRSKRQWVWMLSLWSLCQTPGDKMQERKWLSYRSQMGRGGETGSVRGGTKGEQPHRECRRVLFRSHILYPETRSPWCWKDLHFRVFFSTSWCSRVHQNSGALKFIISYISKLAHVFPPIILLTDKQLGAHLSLKHTRQLYSHAHGPHFPCTRHCSSQRCHHSVVSLELAPGDPFPERQMLPGFIGLGL